MKHGSWTSRSLNWGYVNSSGQWVTSTSISSTGDLRLSGRKRLMMSIYNLGKDIDSVWLSKSEVFTTDLTSLRHHFTVYSMYYRSCSCQVLEGQYQAVRIVLGVQVRKYSKPNLVAFHCWLVGGKQNLTYLGNWYWYVLISSLTHPSWFVSWTSALQSSHFNKNWEIHRNNISKLKQTQLQWHIANKHCKLKCYNKHQ